jgi:hypothetical protein
MPTSIWQGAVYSAHSREGLFLLLVKGCFKVGWRRVGFDVGHDLLGYPLFGGSMLATAVLTVPLSILTGWLSYRLVEVPTTRLRDWVRPTPTSTPPTTPARTGPAPRPSAPRS